MPLDTMGLLIGECIKFLEESVFLMTSIRRFLAEIPFKDLELIYFTTLV